MNFVSKMDFLSVFFFFFFFQFGNATSETSNFSNEKIFNPAAKSEETFFSTFYSNVHVSALLRNFETRKS